MQHPVIEVALGIVVVIVVAAGIEGTPALDRLRRIQQRKSSKRSKPPLPRAQPKRSVPARNHGMVPEQNVS